MDNQEQIKLDQFITSCEKHFKETKESLASIQRGLYGDEANKVPGLIDRQLKDEEAIAKLQANQKKALWLGSGFVAALQAIGITVWEFLKSK